MLKKILAGIAFGAVMAGAGALLIELFTPAMNWVAGLFGGAIPESWRTPLTVATAMLYGVAGFLTPFVDDPEPCDRHDAEWPAGAV